jgi:hypothetical protein
MSCFSFPQDLLHMPSALRTPNHGHTADFDEIHLKVQLRNRLNFNQLSNMPGGFPFHHVFDGHGSAYLSSDSYEFREQFRTSCSDERPRYQCATISFTSPNPRSKCNNLSWRAFLPPRHPPYCRDSVASAGQWSVFLLVKCHVTENLDSQN